MPIKNPEDIFTNKLIISLETQHLHELHQQGFTWKKLAAFYKKSERTIYRWIKPNNHPKQKEGRKPKIVGYVLEILLTYVSDNNTATQQEMAIYLGQQTGRMVSQQTISRVLRKNNYTYKKLTYQYSEQIPRKEEIRCFVDKIKQLPSDKLLALDECSFHLKEDPRRGYSLKGTRAVSQKPSFKGANYTLLLCIQNTNKQAVISHRLIEGGAKTKDFHDFLKTIEFPVDTKNYLLLDNAKIHHAKNKCKELGLIPIRDLLISKNIEPTHLPPYTPELNPTELCFNFLRQQIEKHRPRNLEELKNYIDKVISTLNEKDLTQYFRHCLDYFENTDMSFE